jgi:hypothetical protein
MKQTLTIITFLLLTKVIIAQKNGVFVQYGFKTSNTALKFHEISYIDITSPSEVITKRQQNFTDFFVLKTISIGFLRNIKNNFVLTAALNINGKGYKEVYTYVDSRIDKTLINEAYVGLQLGVRYKFLKKKFGNIYTGLVLNPEMGNIEIFNKQLGKWENKYKFFVSGILKTGLEIKLWENISLSFSPFFEFSLKKYQISGLETYYKPYGFGINMGLTMYF